MQTSHTVRTMSGSLVAAERDARLAATRRLQGMAAMLNSRVALPVSGAVPARPLGLCVATLATADSACIIALRLTTRSATRPDIVDATLKASQALVTASHHGARAVSITSDEVDYSQLSHATAIAAYDAADALLLLAAEGRRLRTPTMPTYPVPRSWRALNTRLHNAILEEKRASSGTRYGVAATSHDAALRAFSVCGDVYNHDGPTAAMHRVTRLTALASVYAGWAALTASGTRA